MWHTISCQSHPSLRNVEKEKLKKKKKKVHPKNDEVQDSPCRIQGTIYVKHLGWNRYSTKVSFFSTSPFFCVAASSAAGTEYWMRWFISWENYILKV